MTDKEKAKAYDEALGRAREYYKGLAACRTKEKLESIFPELKESEDERIRKEIIDWMKGGSTYDWQENKEKWIAYLERQKEPLTPEEKMNHPLYLEGFDVGKKVGVVVSGIWELVGLPKGIMGQ